MSKHGRKHSQPRLVDPGTVQKRALLTVTLVSFAALRLLQFLFAGRYPTTYPDSGTYRVESGSWLDFSLVLSQARPVVVTTFFALLPNDSTRVFGQWLFSTFAWLILLAGVVKLMQRLSVALFAALAIWTVGLSYYAIQWDGIILSESLSVTAAIAGLGFITWWWATKRTTFVFLAIAAFGLAAANRPNLWVLLVAVLLILLTLARNLGIKSAARWAAIALTVLFLLAGLLQQRINDTNFSGGNGLNRIGWSYASMMSDESPLAPTLLPVLIRSGMPVCMIPQKPFVSEEGPINIIVGLQNSCPKGVLWVNKNFLRWYAGFLVNHPVQTVSALGDLVGPSSQPLPYGLDSKVEPPIALQNLFTVKSPGNAWTLFVLSLTAGAITIALSRRQQSTSIVIGLVVLEFSIVASWALGALLQVWDIHRTIVTNVILFNLVALILIAAALDRFLPDQGK